MEIPFMYACLCFYDKNKNFQIVIGFYLFKQSWKISGQIIMLIRAFIVKFDSLGSKVPKFNS